MTEYPVGLPERLHAIWDETHHTVGKMIPDTARESYCGQVWLVRDADQRVADEGAIVTNAKGDAVPHPAITLSRAAGDEIRKWIKAYPPALR